MQMPALDALRTFNREASITLLGAEPALELFADDHRWQALQSVQEWGLRHWGDKGDTACAGAVAGWVEARGFDLFLDVSHAVHAVREAIWSRARAVLDTPIHLPTYGVNGVQALKRAVFNGWGLPVVQEALPRIASAPARRRFAEGFLQPPPAPERPPIGISMVASSSLKRWPTALLAEAADALAGSFNRQVLLFAGPQAGPAAALISEIRTAAVRKVEREHLLDTAALLARCALLICNDTGLMHLAAAAGTPVVAMFGPTAQTIYLPQGRQSRGLSSGVPCSYRITEVFGPSPCLVQERCLIGRRSCIDSVPAETVLQAVGHLLSETLARGAGHGKQ